MTVTGREVHPIGSVCWFLFGSPKKNPEGTPRTAITKTQWRAGNCRMFFSVRGCRGWKIGKIVAIYIFLLFRFCVARKHPVKENVQHAHTPQQTTSLRNIQYPKCVHFISYQDFLRFPTTISRKRNPPPASFFNSSTLPAKPAAPGGSEALPNAKTSRFFVASLGGVGLVTAPSKKNNH